ncbi:MAG: hypothetical protein V1875_07040 [Candidatus Altiarchaeota archaeon]
MVKEVSKPDVRKESRVLGFVRTVVSFIVLGVVLAAAYFAVRYLVGSDLNLDTLLTGSKATSLPKLP